ncbi:MAG TPA: S8 family serine peptidase [Dehalococcoidia bacterium]|nr:S8 family serine peptidase [Dehalococcoidia bacterium]
MRRSHRTPSLLTIAVIAFALALGFHSDVATSSNVIQGDADCSQDVDVEDVGAVLARAASLTGELPCETAANVNCDGAISARDALSILRFVGGVADEAPEYCTSIGDALGDVLIAIDSSLEPDQETIDSLNGGPPQPIEVARDTNGVQMDFVGGEVVYKPENDDDLQAFLDAHNGVVVRDGTTTLAPGAGGAGVQSIDHGYYVIKIDPLTSSLDGFSDDLENAGFTGQVAFSSENAARLMALAVADADLRTQLNPLVQGDTSEHPITPSTYINADTFAYFTNGSFLDIGVSKAWSYLRYQAVVSADDAIPFQAVRVAIIDAGFALNESTGMPLNGNIDFFPAGAKPAQYDVVDGDTTAGGATSVKCQGGFTCPWHGTQAFGACCAIPDNFYGSAGTGGNYVVPILIKHEGRLSEVADAIRTAELLEADVISLSYAYTCGEWCGWFEAGIGDTTDDAGLNGRILLAAAGNMDDSGQPFDIGGDTHVRPCEFPKVICVGSIDQNKDNLRNWGTPVDIWGFEGILTTVTPESAAFDADSLGTDEVSVMNGTSASTPFVAGIVALMKSLNPSLNYTAVRQILQATANPSPDPKVAHGYVNALEAVLAVRFNEPPIINDVRAPLPKQTYNYSGELFRIDGFDPEPGAYLPEFMNQTIAAFLVDGDLLCVTNQLSYRDGLPGYQCVINDAPLGTHDVTIEVRDPFMGIRTVEINEVTFVNTPPLVEVIEPDDGETFYATQSIEFSAFVFDPEEPIPFPQNRIIWESDIDGEFGTGSTFEANLSQGDHTVTVTATDTKGVATAVSFSLNILSGEGIPTVQITSPAESPSFHGPGEQITFIGNATDPEDEALTGASLEWSSSIDGFLGTGEQITATLSGGSNCADYRDHVITLQATDSDSHEVTDEIHVVVTIFC